MVLYLVFVPESVSFLLMMERGCQSALKNYFFFLRKQTKQLKLLQEGIIIKKILMIMFFHVGFICEMFQVGVFVKVLGSVFVLYMILVRFCQSLCFIFSCIFLSFQETVTVIILGAVLYFFYVDTLLENLTDGPIAQLDENFDHFSPFDETSRHIELCNSVQQCIRSILFLQCAAHFLKGLVNNIFPGQSLHIFPNVSRYKIRSIVIRLML